MASLVLDLEEANLREANLRGAEYDETTVWPKGFNPSSAGAHFIDWEKEGIRLPEDFSWDGTAEEFAQ